MEMKQILDQERESILSQLSDAGTADKAQDVMTRSLDRLLFRYQEECEQPHLKAAAFHMIQTAKASLSLADSAGEPEIWERDNPDADFGKPSGKQKVKKYVTTVGMILLVAALALVGSGIGYLLHFHMELLQDGSWEWPAGLAGCGVVLLFLAGFFFRRPKKAVKKETRVVNKCDPDKLYRSLQLMVLTIDAQLAEADEEEKAAERKRQAEAGAVLPQEEVDLYSALLEAAYSRDGEYALERMEDLQYYLHKKQVEVVDYSREKDSWFEKMPAAKSGTIRPALAYGGTLLKKGLAAEEQ